MAINPFATFHKNKRFWMAIVLGICMVTFILGQQLLQEIGKIGRSSGPTVVVIGGQSLSSSDLHDLKAQRNLVNDFMKISGELAFKKLQSQMFELAKKEVGEKDKEMRAKMLIQMERIRDTIAIRKARPRYFDLGVKFDDLVEFRLWQAEANRLGVRLEPEQMDYLLRYEFLAISNLFTLTDQEFAAALSEAKRNYATANDAYFRRALAEEFRVRIAQYAALEAQPFAYFSRDRKDEQGAHFKFSSPAMPDELRIPMTLAQIHDYFKAQRSEFEVTLLPLPVKNYVEWIKGDPNEIQKRDFFEARKNKPIDPASDIWGFEIPPQIQIRYVTADPSAPGYHDVAKLLALLSSVSPVANDPMSSPFVTASRYVAVHEKKMIDLQNQYDRQSQAFQSQSTKFSWPGSSSAIAARLSRQDPQAAASAAASALLAPAGALGNYLAWGATKHPAELAAAEHAELKRRAPIYATLVGSALALNPLEFGGSALAMDLRPIQAGLPFYIAMDPQLPVEAIADEITAIITRQTAEEWAQANIRKLKKALDGATDAESFKRAFNKNFTELNLVYGPPDDKKDNYYSRFSVSTAPELEPLRDAYLKYMDMINLFEGRDATPERMLKAGDFYKMFFDPTEAFSASSPYRAMPWPPEVRPNIARLWRADLDPRLINRNNINVGEAERFQRHLAEHDPTKQPPNFELFNKASKPILFWRTGEISAVRVGDYAKIEKDLKKAAAELGKIDEEIKANAKDLFKVNELNRKRASAAKIEADFKEIQARIVEGWKFDQARDKVVLPRANEIALEVMKKPDDPRTYLAEAAKLKTSLITLSNVSLMHQEQVSQVAKDYFPYPLPKGQIEYPRDDMMQHIVNLYHPKGPVVIGDEQIDALNKKLFDLASKEKNPAGKFVQILTNKPRSVYYVAAVSKLPAMNRIQLREAYMYAANVGMNPQAFRQEHDLFIQRAQETFARQQRASYIQNIKDLVGFEIKDEAARKTFDDRGND